MHSARPFPVAPLLAVDRAELAALVRPFVPDPDPVLLQPGDVGLAAQEPEQFDDYRAQVELLGGQKREAVGKVEAHLVAEDGEGADSGPVFLLGALVEDPGE